MMNRINIFAAALAALAGSAPPSPTFAAQAPDSGVWAVRTVDRPSGQPVSDAFVDFPEHGASGVTDDRGLVNGHGTGPAVRVLARRLGYADLDTLVAVPKAGGVVVLLLERSAVELPPLTVEAERRMTSIELHRLVFDREVAVGAVGMTQAEIKAVPPMVESDVLRSLQALAGVSSVNDYSGELFVRGGGSDQVAVLIDGAPVFAPYHMFGLFGAFNADAVESTEFYRGSIPARYGGALSGVVAARQKTGSADETRFAGGVSLLGVRFAADGSAPWGGIRWLAAGRKAFVDVATIDVPYSFHDVNFGLEAHPADEHRLRFSVFASDDEFDWDLSSSETQYSFTSEWANLATSATWSWVPGHRLSSDVTAYYSRYDGERTTGGTASSPVTTNRISATGLRAGVTLRGDRFGGRAGVAIEAGPVTLRTTGGMGGYVDGDISNSYQHLSAFAELEGWAGPLRIAPGVRAGSERRSGRNFVEPRFSVRLRMPAFAVSASVDRTYQFLSVLRDAYSLEPGAPMWFLHGRDAPVSAADGASVSVDTWRGDEWTASVAGWTRRFRSAPHWRPILSRDPSDVEHHDGRARGLEVMVQRHSGRVRGWLSYQWARTAFSDASGAEYAPQWDRRHEFDGLMATDLPGGVEASLRTTVGTGGPFWFPAGAYDVLRFGPVQRINGIGELRGGSYLTRSDMMKIWSDAQGRLPVYARLDLSVRRAFRWGSWDLVPYLSVVNAGNRKNVLQYYFTGFTAPDEPYVFEPGRQMPLFPSIGIDVRF